MQFVQIMFCAFFLINSFKLLLFRYKFDDERVTKEDLKRALEEQYGGEEEVLFSCSIFHDLNPNPNSSSLTYLLSCLFSYHRLILVSIITLLSNSQSTRMLTCLYISEKVTKIK